MNLFGISDFGLFCLAVLLLNATPGPDTAYIVGRSVAQGRAAGLVSALGITLGCCVHTVALAVGLSALLATSATAFLVVKLVGGAYLVYLGMRMMLAKSPIAATATTRPAEPLAARSLKTICRQAAITNILNPKVVLFFLSFIPQFVSADNPHKVIAFLLLGFTMAVISLVWNSGTALLAGTLARRAHHSPRIRQWLERTVGAAFVALGVKLAFSDNQ